MNHVRIVCSILAGLFALCLQSAGAQEEDPVVRLKKLAGQFDEDKDKALSAEEREKFLDHIDKTRGSKVKRRLAAILKKADADGDGLVTEKEWGKLTGDAEDAEDPKESSGAPDSREWTVMLPMSDGVKLATDIFLPEGKGPFPVVLQRTPYGRNRGKKKLTAYPKYALVVQDHRGRFDSEGENFPFVGCGWVKWQDGKETVEWIQKQKWCSGKIVSVGGSAGGITQNLMAGAVPDGLTAQFIVVAAASLYHHASYVGGALRKAQVEGWSQSNKFSPKALALMKAHPDYDEYWHMFDSTLKHPVMNVPAIHQGGWFDTFAQGTIDSYVGRQHEGAPGARGKQKLVMGPWAHGGWGKPYAGELQFPDNKSPESHSRDRWLEYHLEGKDNGIMHDPAVAYYVMGDTKDPKAPGNEWRFSDDWPIPCDETGYYFGSGGTLGTEKPDSAKTLEYTFDPKDPVPTKGGCNLVLDRGPYNQNPVESREDVLLFTTPVLEKPVEVTGRVRAKVWVKPSTVDTDLSIRLCDVYPDGKSYLMAEGMLRLRYRNSFEEPEPLKPGEWVEVDVDCWSTSIIFNKGHRIRVAVTSSNFPRFDVNPGTGRPWTDGCKMVEQTNGIGCGGSKASRIVLPVIP